jgi:hypothetical protein
VRIVIAAVAALLFSVAVLQDSDRSRGATPTGQPSVEVGVIPGFVSPTSPGYYGIPKLPVDDPSLAKFHFTAVPAANVNSAKLQQFDTVILYGIPWVKLSSKAQQAINGFAATGKVVIWDSDDLGPQNYANFIHPFSDAASGENGKANDSVVSFPGGNNFLASSNPSSPYYLDPKQLVANRNMINDMNAMKTGTKNWLPALVAQNQNIPEGGWALAWSYGVIGNHTGLTIYSGLDADAINNTQLNPNNEITELLLELKAPFFTTPDQSCSPNCGLPTSSGGGSTHAACSFAKPVPTHWVHGRVPISLKTSVADGITGRVLSPSGRLLAAGKERNGLIHFRVRTRPLRSNHASRLRALVLVSGRRACGLSFRLKVDNTPPRLLYLRTTTNSHGRRVSFRVSEGSQMRISGGGPNYRNWVAVAPRRLINVRLPGSVRVARLILRDRAGNTLERKLVW